MKKIRTRRFHTALWISTGFSALFLSVFVFFGNAIAQQSIALMTDCVFFVMLLATASFLAVCFAPYFRGERRWFAIPSLLTAVFFVGAVLLWQLPVPAAVTV